MAKFNKSVPSKGTDLDKDFVPTKADPTTDRKEFQEKESYPEHKDDLAKSRFQDSKQTDPVESTQSSASTVTGAKSTTSKELVPTAARDIKKAMSISPNADVELLDGKQVGGVPLANPDLLRSVAGTGDVSVAKDMSRSPYSEGGKRPDSRFGKKNTVQNFVIDNAVCEQIAPHYDEVPDLAKSSDTSVGYNGRKQYTTARGKKNAGTAPQQMLFDRSIDFEHNSFVVHTTGQVLDSIEGKASYPTVTTNANFGTVAHAGLDGYVDITHPMQKSNYLLRSFKFSLVDGKISNPRFEEERIDSHVDDSSIEQANMNWQIDNNNVIHSVIRLQTELGRETTEKWSPLGYVIGQPYQFNMLAHDMEATTGALMALAYRSSAYAQSFQLNLLGKDGAKPVTPMYRAFWDGIKHHSNSEYYDHLGGYHDNLFDKASYLGGSAAAMIDAFDSTPKYNTKADVMNQPRSLKVWLQSVDNNIDPLHCKAEFMHAIDSVTMFSTTDGIYNPLLPIHVTDQVRVINPLSLNYFLQGWVRPAILDGVSTGTKSIYQYSYKELRNDSYTWYMKHPLVEGLLRWMLNHEGALAKAYGSHGTVDVTWPCSFDMTSFNMFAYVLCAAAYDVNYMRNVVFRDFLFAGDQSEYIWSDLASLTTLNPLGSSQLGYVDYASPLKLGKLTTASVLREFWPETYVPRKNTHGVNSTDYLMPWYLSEYSASQFSVENGFLNPKQPASMNYPSRRSGVNHSVFDIVYSLTPEDLFLAIDRVVRPLYPTQLTTFVGPSGDDAGLYHNITDVGSNPYTVVAYRSDVQSDGRLILVADNDDNMLKYASVYEAPRQFGFIFPDVGFTPIADGTNATTEDLLLGRPLDVQGARYIESYQALGSLTPAGVATEEITRTAALQQSWYRCFMNRRPLVVAENLAFEAKTGMIFGLAALMSSPNLASNATLDSDDVSLKSVWPLNGSGSTALTTNVTDITFSKLFWTAIQRSFFPIDPYVGVFDAGAALTSDSPTAIVPVDNMEQSVYFGFAGFKAADANQLILQRLNNMDQLNVSYVTDDFLSKSIIFRGSN